MLHESKALDEIHLLMASNRGLKMKNQENGPPVFLKQSNMLLISTNYKNCIVCIYPPTLWVMGV
jgi:hypothetical protein